MALLDMTELFKRQCEIRVSSHNNSYSAMFAVFPGLWRGVRVCGDAVLLNFSCGFAEIFISSCGFALFQNYAVCGI